MKLQVAKDCLVRGVQMIQSVISTHTTVPILYNVLLTADKNRLYLTATDLYVGMRYSVEADVKKAGATTVQARRLLSIARELPQAQVTVEADDKNTVQIQCGSSSFKIFGLSADEYPPLPLCEERCAMTLDQGAFKDMLKRTVYAVSTDESRQILNGILMHFKDQKVTLVATDGRRLALAEQEVEIPPEAQTSVVVPTKTVNELIKVLKEEGPLKIQTRVSTPVEKGPDATAEGKAGASSMITFESEEVTVISRLVDGTYPNYQQVIPGRSEERVVLEREQFLEALRRVALVTSDKFPSIKVALGKNQMQISAMAPDVGEAQETVPIKYAGKAITTAFNPDFLMDPLRNLSCDEVIMELVDDISPVVIKCDQPFLYVLMPLRVN